VSMMRKPMPQPGTEPSPSHIADHDFVPTSLDRWYETCGFRYPDGRLCNLAESSHKGTTILRDERGKVTGLRAGQ
jgi:hypothetical protein